MCPPTNPQQDLRESVRRYCLAAIRNSGGDGGCRCFARGFFLRGPLGEAQAHEQAAVLRGEVHAIEKKADADFLCGCPSHPSVVRL